jgi:polyisoprenyl-phosphate glycosyltransferase
VGDHSNNSASHRAGKKVCVICPCFNEEDVVPFFFKEVQCELDRLRTVGIESNILFVDDGSSDGTLERLCSFAAEDDRVGVVSLSRNFGHQVALSAGLDHADADAVIMMDSDLQHPPAVIDRLVREWLVGFEIVSAVRSRTEGASAFKNVTASLFYKVFNFFSETKISPGAADFCLLARPAYEAARQMPERHRFLRGIVSWIGFRRTMVYYTAPPRAAGRSKYDPARMFALAFDAVLSFSAGPIRMAAKVGTVAVLLAGLYFVYILGAYLFGRNLVAGWASLIAVVLGMGGFQLLFIGLIGEYLARIYEESKHRPLYILRKVTLPRRIEPLQSHPGSATRERTFEASV